MGSLGINPFKYFDPFPSKLNSVQENILRNHFEYYNALPEKLKPHFRSRLSKFIKSKTFIAKENIVITEEIKTLISASAIQLTFGLTKYKLPHFKHIIIYPEAYFSSYSNKMHKGETNVKGAVVFSWIDFKSGYANASDNINLGLHEFAHALLINFRKDYSPDINFGLYYNQWQEIGTEEFFKLKQGKKYFRSYAKSNLMEFFAISIEHFFENPHQLKKNYPELFEVLKKLLGQNPCKWTKQTF